MKHLVNIGPLPYISEPERTGGVVVLFRQWLFFCSTAVSDFTLIDSNTHNYRNPLFAAYSICKQIWNAANKNSILFLHGTAKDYLFIAPLAIFIAKLRGAKTALRKFAGNFDVIYNSSTWWKRIIYNYVLRNADVTFWETQHLVEFGRQHNTSYWFANTRPAPKHHRDKNMPYAREFIFLSRVSRTKGVLELAECFKTLPDGYSLDIYGPLDKDIDVSKLNFPGCTYCGNVPPTNVAEVLSRYDAMILPSRHIAEGYPGVIIESFAAGLPVLATPMGGITEMVQHNYNGLRIDSCCAEDIRKAVLYIDSENYIRLAEGASASFAKYDAAIVNPNVLKILQGL